MRCVLIVCSSTVLLILGCGDGDSGPHAVARKSRIAANTHEGMEESSVGPSRMGGSGGTVQFGAIALTAPDSWPRKAPQSSFTVAEFVLPGAQGAETDGRLTLSVAGGSIENNVERWKGQFGGADVKAKQETLTTNGIQITMVDLSGDFNDQRGPYAPATKRRDYRMIAAIIPVGGELHFVKGVGPLPTLQAHAERIKEFIKTVRTNE